MPTARCSTRVASLALRCTASKKSDVLPVCQIGAPRRCSLPNPRPMFDRFPQTSISLHDGHGLAIGWKVVMGIRPQQIAELPAGGVPATVRVIEPTGADTNAIVDCAGYKMTVFCRRISTSQWATRSSLTSIRAMRVSSTPRRRCVSASGRRTGPEFYAKMLSRDLGQIPLLSRVPWETGIRSGRGGSKPRHR